MALTKVRRGGTDTGIADSSDATAITIDSSENITTTNAGTITAGRFINGTSSNDPWLKGVNSSGTETFFVKPDGTLHANGNVLVGTTSTNLSNTDSDEHIILEQDGEFKIQGAAKILMTLNRNQTAGEIISIKQENTAVGGIDANSSSVDFNTSSDYRLKENVTTSWDATTRLKQLKPVRFSWKKEGKSEADTDGFLAHEVSSVVPQATKGTKDEVVTQKGIDDGIYPKDAKIGDAYMQSIDHSKLVPLLVKTIQELEARIATLESK